MEDPKPDATVVIYRDGKREEIPAREFLAMLEELKHG